MSTVIFTHAISGASGIDKSVIYTANVLAKYNVDTYIYTLADHNRGGNVFAQPLHFELDDRIKTYPILNYNIENTNKIQLLNTIMYSINHTFLKMNITKYHCEAMKQICANLTKEDTIIFANPIASELFKKSQSQTKAFKILQIHSDYEKDIENMEHLKSSYDIVDYIQTVSKGMNNYLESKFKLTDKQIGTIYNVISMDESKKIVKEKSDKIIISIIGSFQERKNQLDAIKALELLDNQYVLHMYGEPHGDYYEEVVQYIDEKQLTEKVIIKGFEDEKTIYSNSDIVVVTSISEGFGYTLAEAIKNGIPIISYDYKYGANEIVENGVNGYLIEQGNFQELSSKIKYLIENDNYEVLRDNCIESYKRKFANETIFKEYNKFINPDSINRNIHKYLVKKKEYDFKVNIIDNHLYKWRRSTIEILCGDDFFQNNKLKKVSIMHLNKKYELKFAVKGNKIIANIAGIGVHIIYTLYLELDNNQEYYVCNRSFRGNIEKLNRNNINGNIYINNMYDEYLNTLYITEMRTDRVISIEDKNNNIKSFSYIDQKYEGIYQRLIKVEDVNSRVNVKLQSGKIINITPTSNTYQMIWDKFLKLEKDKKLFERTIDGIHYWELIKSPLIIEIMKNNMLWKENINKKIKYEIPVDYKKVVYTNKQRVSFKNKRLICNVGTNYNLYEHLIDENTLLHANCIESYLNYYSQYENNVALHSYEDLKKYSISKEVMEMINTEALYISEILNYDYEMVKDNIKIRYLKFKYSYDFYYSFLKDTNIQEVVVISSIWDQGIVLAAKQLGIKVSELQYAFISDNHLNYGISSDRNYAPDNIYLWNNYWETKSDFAKYQTVLEKDEKYDFAIISQHLLTDYTIKIAELLSEKYPNKKIAILAHPSEKINQKISGKVDIVYGDTVKVAMSSVKVFGYYSTALFQILEHDDIYVVKTPGWEMTRQEVKFKVISLDDISKEV